MSKKHAKKKKNEPPKDKKSARKELSPFEKANLCREMTPDPDIARLIDRLQYRCKKSIPQNTIFVTHHHKRTVSLAKWVHDQSEKVYSHMKQNGLNVNFSFYDDMALYKSDRGVPLHALQAALAINAALTNKQAFQEPMDIKSRAKLGASFRDSDLLAHEVFESRVKSKLGMEQVQVMLNELGCYLTWIKEMERDVRRYVKVVSRMMPAYYTDEDRRITSFLLCDNKTGLNIRELGRLERYQDKKVYQKAFIGMEGLYGMFFSYVKVLADFCLDLEKKIELDAGYWAFDFDVRRPFIGMASYTRFLKDPDIVTKSRSYFSTKTSSYKTCICGGEGTLPWHAPTAPDCAYEQYLTCDKANCIQASYYRIVPIWKRLLLTMCDKKSDDALRKKTWAEARDNIPFCTFLTDFNFLLDQTYDVYKDSRTPWGYGGLGYDWTSWNYGPVERIRFCWNCYESGTKLNVCSGCRRARYCGLQCAKDHWPSHKQFCIVRDIVRSAVMERKEKQKTEMNEVGKVVKVDKEMSVCPVADNQRDDAPPPNSIMIDVGSVGKTEFTENNITFTVEVVSVDNNENKHLKQMEHSTQKKEEQQLIPVKTKKLLEKKALLEEELLEKKKEEEVLQEVIEEESEALRKMKEENELLLVEKKELLATKKELLDMEKEHLEEKSQDKEKKSPAKNSESLEKQHLENVKIIEKKLQESMELRDEAELPDEKLKEKALLNKSLSSEIKKERHEENEVIIKKQSLTGKKLGKEVRKAMDVLFDENKVVFKEKESLISNETELLIEHRVLENLSVEKVDLSTKKKKKKLSSKKETLLVEQNEVVFVEKKEIRTSGNQGGARVSVEVEFKICKSGPGARNRR